MTRRKPAPETWSCICTPSFPAHRFPESCARHLQMNLDMARQRVDFLETSFGLKESAGAAGLFCACGGPLFKYSDPENKTRICPYCAARYIQYLKALVNERH